MIINTGQRTDIPAFYTPWFINRLKEGFVMVRNPYNDQQVTRYTLSPDVVDVMAFCSKNPEPMLPYLSMLDKYAGQYWFVTITPYGREMEPNVPDKYDVMDSFKVISKHVGLDSIAWRYDPIIVNEEYTVKWHIEMFEKMAEYLKGYTRVCIISFLDLYSKVKRNYPEGREVERLDRLNLGEAFSKIGQKYGMKIRACAEGNELAEYGVDCHGCMTQSIIEKALSMKLDAPKKKPIRGECSCLMGNDIGQYNTCLHLCRYCYANYDEATVMKNRRFHDPYSPFLIGGSRPTDKVSESNQESWIIRQRDLFDEF